MIKFLHKHAEEAGLGAAMLLVVAALWIAWVFAAAVTNPADQAAKKLVDPAFGTNIGRTAQPTATALCGYTDFTAVLVVQGIDKHYEGKIVREDVRYDLTWQIGGNVVAVEELRGRELKLWTDQVDDGFIACIASKDIPEVRPRP